LKMVWSYTVDPQVKIVGVERVYTGTYTNTVASTGGNIVTPLTRVTDFTLKVDGATVDADFPSYDETLPLTGGTVTIVTTAVSTGRWTATGTF
jgi:hypothetical protein